MTAYEPSSAGHNANRFPHRKRYPLAPSSSGDILRFACRGGKIRAGAWCLWPFLPWLTEEAVSAKNLELLLKFLNRILFFIQGQVICRQYARVLPWGEETSNCTSCLAGSGVAPAGAVWLSRRASGRGSRFFISSHEHTRRSRTGHQLISGRPKVHEGYARRRLDF